MDKDTGSGLFDLLELASRHLQEYSTSGPSLFSAVVARSGDAVPLSVAPEFDEMQAMST